MCAVKMKYVQEIIPADFTFQHFKSLEETSPDEVQNIRIGAPPLGSNNKLDTNAVWLNNNLLKSMKSLDIFVESILECPQCLRWLDLSFNKLTEIDLVLLKFSNLSTLNLHANKIGESKEIVKLKPLKYLKFLTLHGNPVYSKKNYRMFTITTLPQIVSLDFTRITNAERKLATVVDRRMD